MNEKSEQTNGVANGGAIMSQEQGDRPGTNGNAPEHGRDTAESAQDTSDTQEKSEKDHSPEKEEDKGQEEKQPPGGWDGTPVPPAEPGYTIKITFHRATNLPMADINTLSSDPFVLAQLNTAYPPRHKEDPFLRMRTPTIRRNTDPVWEFEWIVANVPASGFKLKARVYDEDPADHDDRLGNVHVNIHNIDENWPGIKNQPYKIMKRSGSKRAYMIRACAACVSKAKHMNGDLYISIEVLGRTEGNAGARAYTIGPCWWIRHYSPMLGRIANRKEPDESPNDHAGETDAEKSKRKAQRYNFQANQMQLQGPIPAELYHRYVEFKPFVKSMFTGKGIGGFLLSKALHHQHARVYNFDRSTVWGHFPQGPCEDLTRAFLDLVHYDEGGRIFTYVLTLDSLFRFTETGKEFGIDMLSKHTMHSDVSIYIAFSGEFFIRRLKHANRPPPPEPVESTSQVHPPDHAENETHPPEDIGDGPPDDDPPKDPAYYELVIDNDSGTYRPNAKMLPILKKFLSHNLPGLHIQTLDCQADEERMTKMKKEQRDRKQKEGDKIVYAQGSRSSSISSSDESDLDSVERRRTFEERGTLGQLGHDAQLRGKSRYEHWKANVGRGPSRPFSDDEDDDAAAGASSQAGPGASDRGRATEKGEPTHTHGHDPEQSAKDMISPHGNSEPGSKAQQ
ncbi:hypothetical protein AAFC00_003615 [Neodothiora populina]|uniref:C2 domain-containing protein n=1 Tax=Neodothiora populina TaxID=2781224 RepID=A0ABR3PF58_9PEZI